MKASSRYPHLAILAALSGPLFLSAPLSAKEREGRDRHSAFQIGLWGDLPYARAGYGGVDSPKMQALIKDMNDSRLAFSVFDGDTKDGSSACNDAALVTEPSRMFNMLKAPVVYVLGDNEWTDCHRINNGSYNSLERLDVIRKTMHGSRYSFGKNKMKLERQGEPGQAFSENTRWSLNGVYFVGLHVVGSNNNKVNPGQCLSPASARTQEDCDADNLEYAERNASTLAWLTESFQVAKAHCAPGLMIVIQADPGFDLPETAENERLTRPNIDGFTDLLDTLVKEAATFEGQIALIHGDTHFFKVDKPLLNPAQLIPKITRVETFGENNVHWVRATIDPKSSDVFTFEPMIVPGN